MPVGLEAKLLNVIANYTNNEKKKNHSIEIDSEINTIKIIFKREKTKANIKVAKV